MKLSQRLLRTLIEAEIDKMRVPKGQNSRDDADDEVLDELFSINEASAKGELWDTLDGVASGVANQVSDFASRQIADALADPKLVKILQSKKMMPSAERVEKAADEIERQTKRMLYSLLGIMG